MVPATSCNCCRHRSLLAALLALGLAAPVAFRRRAPGRALAIVLALWVVTLVSGAEITRGPFLPLAFVLYVVACTSRRAVAAAGLAAALILLGVQGLEMHFSGQGSGNAVAVGLMLTIIWVVGYSVQQRRSYMRQVRERAASDAVTLERLRIARELHDVVAHSMTVVTVQAGYGEYVFDSQPGEARAALGAIQSVSREALGEMQRLLGVLRQTSAEAGGEAPLAASAERRARRRWPPARRRRRGAAGRRGGRRARPPVPARARSVPAGTSRPLSHRAAVAPAGPASPVAAGRSRRAGGRDWRRDPPGPPGGRRRAGRSRRPGPGGPPGTRHRPRARGRRHGQPMGPGSSPARARAGAGQPGSPGRADRRGGCAGERSSAPAPPGASPRASTCPRTASCRRH